MPRSSPWTENRTGSKNQERRSESFRCGMGNLTVPLGNVLTARVGKVLDIYTWTARPSGKRSRASELFRPARRRGSSSIIPSRSDRGSWTFSSGRVSGPRSITSKSKFRATSIRPTAPNRPSPTRARNFSVPILPTTDAGMNTG